ncbi:MAG: Rossmann-like domain-containing protein, partial [bacterium]
MDILEEALVKFKMVVDSLAIEREEITIKARGLSSEEAIGNPHRDDFPLSEGDEVMIQAEFMGEYGQAFTDHPGNFQGSLQELFELPLENNYQRALRVAAMNAVLRSRDLVEGTVHCHDEEPRQCAEDIIDWLEDKHPEVEKLGIIGYQPAIVDECLEHYGADKVEVTDINEERIGRELPGGAEIKSGRKENKALIERADFILATGSTVINGSMDELLDYFEETGTEHTFFGNTIAAVAYLLDLPRLCFYAS